MRRRRLLDALDSPLPLLFVEAVPGRGKRTLLTQWAELSGGQEREHRLVIDVGRPTTDGFGLLRLIWSALRRERDLDLPELPAADEEIMPAALRHLAGVHRPIAIGLLEADYIAVEAFTAMLDLLRAGVRLIVTGFDVSLLIEAAQSRRVHFSRLDDQDMDFTLEETRTFMVEAGLAPSEEAVAAMHRSTHGHPGLIKASMTVAPAESASGRVTPDRSLGSFLATVPLEGWPSQFAGFFIALMRIPRFSAQEAAIIAQVETAPALMHRLCTLGLGEMSWHQGMRQRVFRWHEPVRMMIVQFVPDREEPDTALRDRIIEAARACGDHELLVATLVGSGELEQAEALLHDWLWDVLPNTSSPLWGPLEAIGTSALVDRPGLLCIRLRLNAPPRQSSAVAVAASAARKAVAGASRAEGWHRLADLARALELTRHLGDPDELTELSLRARGLVADLTAVDVASCVTSGAISDLLVITEVLLRTGNPFNAGDFAARAAELIEIDTDRLDPTGDRRAAARRGILLSDRARGVDEPVGSEVLLSGLQFLWRDVDIIAAHLAIMWAELDAGDAEAADARCRIAAELVTDPASWPLLGYYRAWFDVLRRPTRDRQAVAVSFRQTSGRQDDERSARPIRETSMSESETLVSRIAGETIEHPEFVPLPESTNGRPFHPRAVHAAQLIEALAALRAGRISVARVCLERAIAALPRRSLSPFSLARATVDEIHSLADIIRDHPTAPRLNLEGAVQFARTTAGQEVAFSDRELEILTFLRNRATNNEMAQAMFLSVNTVKFHRANLMRKLGAKSRDEVLEAAALLGLL